MDYKKVIQENIEILKRHGIKKQMIIWVEELSELTKVICKWSRAYDELEGDITPQLLSDFHDEITDVTISLDQIKYAIGFMEDALMKKYEEKVNRQNRRDGI